MVPLVLPLATWLGLMVAIEKAEKEMAGISERGLKEAKDRVETWKAAENALRQACASWLRTIPKRQIWS